MRTSLFIAVGRAVALTLVLAFPRDSFPQSAELLVRLTRSACYGFCPDYSVEIRTDGTVTYEGHYYVVTEGLAVGHLDQDSIRLLREAFERAQFRSLASDCCNCPEATDQPTARVTFVDGQFSKDIEDYHGCSKTPKALRVLEDEIDDIVHIEQWIGTAVERRRLRELRR